MKTHMITVAVLVALALLAAGCGTSKPTQFITLASVPGARRQWTGPVLKVGKVTLPPALDRIALVRQLAGDRMTVDGAVEWVGPLDEMFRRTLAQDLAARLPAGMVELPGQPETGKPVRLVVVTVETFWAGADRTVTLKSQWSIVPPGAQKATLSRESRVTTAVASDNAADVARGMSAAVGKLADEIAAEQVRAHE